MKPIIQVALDILEIERAVQIAKEAVMGGVDWIEAGTPLIKSEGMKAVRILKKTFPDHTIIADLKVVDTGAVEVEMAAKAGADIVMVLANADDATIQEAVLSAHKYGVRLMADMINVNEPVKRAQELERLGIDYINVHTGIDQQMRGKDPIEVLEAIVRVVNVPLAVAGGLDAHNASVAIQAGVNIVIVGGNIINSDHVENAARSIRQGVDALSMISADRISTKSEMKKLFSEVSTPNISDAMHRKGAMKDIHSMVKGSKMVGTAVTVQTFEGDWAKSVEAIDVAEAGDVIVIYNGSKHIAPWGGLATLSCLNKEIAGIVIDGAVRDIEEIQKLGLPVFASNNVPNAGDPKGFGEINAQIKCGGLEVNPGDYIIGDDNGVVVVPKEQAYEISRRAKEVEKSEKRIYAEIKNGSTLSKVLNLKKWEKH
ncbi:MAG: bifunctional hexulose-6-phosphate synthase/ribonuclease regulator [Methanosarcinaceae archaeon]|nr:bifunctional hexulose-6-phosphate synthase/ribonuclease regulator [Methanosarcinaceae archaeon]